VLRSRSISLDLLGTGTHTLVAPPDGLLGQLGLTQSDFTEVPESLDVLADPNLDCRGLPDAIFVLGPLPHPGARNLIQRCNYHMRPLPFADAMHLSHNHIYGAAVPNGTYRLDPPEPDGTLQTIGTQLLLVANKDVSDGAVQKLLSAILETSFSHLYEPPLDIGQLSIVPEFPQHSGVAAYISAREPVTMEALSTASKVIGLATTFIPISILVLRTFTRWRARHRISNLRQMMADVAGIEEAAHQGVPREAAIILQAQLFHLRSTALRKSATGDLQNVELLPAYLGYIAAVDSILDRLGHSRSADGVRGVASEQPT
jgi:hypothetical protein